MLAILYCRQQRVEQIHAADTEKAIDQATRMLESLTDEERRDWTMVTVEGEEIHRLFGPKV